MDFKNFILKNKKMVIGGLVATGLGTFIGVTGRITEADYNLSVKRNEELKGNISSIDENYKGKNEELEKLLKEKNFLLEENNRIEEEKRIAAEEIARVEKEEAEKLAIEEAEKAEKEEAEKLAKAEAEKKAEEKATEESNKGNNNSGTSVGNNSGNSSGSNTSNKKPTTTKPNNSGSSSSNAEEPKAEMVWKTKSGKKYHSKNNCGNTDSAKATKITIKSAKSAGLTACSKCY
ncbi:MAG: hypothetical protein ACRDD2_10250 [Sarcina sp.]